MNRNRHDVDPVSDFRGQMRIFRYIIIGALCLLAGGCLMLFLLHVSATVNGHGVVAGLRHWQLASSVSSRIVKLNAREGDFVTAGTVLAELDDRDYRRRYEALENSIRELEASIRVREWRLKLLEIDPLPEEYRHTRIALEESRERVRNAERELAAYRELFEKKAVPELEFHRRELEMVKERAVLEKLEMDFATVESGLADSILGEARAEIEILNRRIESAKRELEMLAREADEYRFVAPEDGTVCDIPSRTGTYVKPGDVVVDFAAAGPKKFIAEIEEGDVHRISEGQPVKIASSQYDHYKYGYFPGEVMYVGELPRESGGRRYYPVFIRITEEPVPLRIGSSGYAKISVGESRMILWLTGTD